MNVLLLEDDWDLRRTLHEGLQASFPTFRIKAAASAEEAEDILARGFEPKLLVCDVHLPGKGGVSFVLEVQARLPEACFILISGYEPPEALQAVDRDRMLRFLPKPFELDELAREVQAAYMKDQFSGRHQRISFVDILQVLNMAGRTALMTLRLPQTGENGEIWVVDGEVHHAVLSDLEGAEAFRALCRHGDAVFQVRTDRRPPRRTIDSAFGALLLRSMGDDEG